MGEIITPCRRSIWTPILPTVFSESLSYLEQLSAFSKKLNELIESYNKFSGDYENYVQEQLKPYQSQIDELTNRFNSIINEINENIDAFKVETNAKISAQNEAITALRNDTNAKIDSYKTEIFDALDEKQKEIYAYVEAELLRLKTDITTQVSLQLSFLRRLIDGHDKNVLSIVDAKLIEFLGKIPTGTQLVINPTSGTIDTLQETLYDMYDYYRVDGLTAQQYDALELTAEAYDAQGLTAYEYDFYSLRTLTIDERFYMYDPFNGSFKLISNVVDELADLHKGDSSFTAEGYDALEVTASRYDEQALTAYSYDWQGKLLLTA
nr:MAG TPA: hypothetical protein [Caudoviricetes sp.]